MSYCAKAREFSEVMYPGQCLDVPTKLTSEKVSYITTMVNDELEELAEAETVVEQADALVDAIYYLCSFAAQNGINLDPIYKLVHQANMRKVHPDGTIKYKEYGGGRKVEKPSGWVGPEREIYDELKIQHSNGSFV